MPQTLLLIIGLLLIAVCLGAAVGRPFGLSEATVAVPCSAVALLSGATGTSTAWHSVRGLAPTVAFLAAILAFGHLCATAGVFRYLGSVTAHFSGGAPKRLLILVVAFAAVITATLTLDATVVLVTPVVLATTARMSVPNRPHSYACSHIANSGSLLLPVSNLTNLLAFTASGLSFGRFAAVMAAAVGAGLRAGLGIVAAGVPVRSRRRAARRRHRCWTRPGTRWRCWRPPSPASWPPPPSGWRRRGPRWPAAWPWPSPSCATAARPRPGWCSRASPGFCAFVLSLGVLVAGVLSHGADRALRHVLPSGTGLLALLGLALVAAVLANLVNNLPTTLALVPLVAAHPVAVLAVLVGVNLGPNATYPGSLATLLWRRSLPDDDRPRAIEFHALGLLSTPVIVVAVTVLLWACARIVGVG